MLIGLLRKIASKKMISRWRDDFELDEWQALFKLTNVAVLIVPEFALIGQRLNQPDHPFEARVIQAALLD